MNKIKIKPYLNEWSKYGQWRHPFQWWEIALTKYLKTTNNLKDAPKLNVIKVLEHEIRYCMKKDKVDRVISKKTIIEVLYPESN